MVSDSMNTMDSKDLVDLDYFRPCIDVHQGQVKQIVGSTLMSDTLKENYIAPHTIEYFADHYAHHHLRGGHLIMLDQEKSTRKAVLSVIKKYPGSYQVGGGMDPEKGTDWLSWGAEKIILSSYLFPQGCFREQRLKQISRLWGKSRLTVDLSSVWVGGEYRSAIHGWKTITDLSITPETLNRFGNYCGEILIHAIDKEGKQAGIDKRLFTLLVESCPIPFVYAGGIHSLEEVKNISQHSKRLGGRIGFTVGSSLDLFGGDLSLEEILKITRSYR